MNDDAIVVEGLQKAYGSVRALCGVDFTARTGSVLGLLGPNGAGKTTAVRILTTLLQPDGGSARVAGLDVVHDAAALRAKIGLAGQYAAVDENLTGFENLEMVGRLYHLARRGKRVLGLERFRLGHDRGASQDHSRIIRLSYHAPEYARLALDTYAAWSEVEEASGVQLVVTTGAFLLKTETLGDSIGAGCCEGD